MKAYQRGPYRVEIEDSGEIKVKPGDILGAYSMAIHGNPWTLGEYVRCDARRQLIRIADYNKIYAGEVLYHLPTVAKYSKRPSPTRISFSDASIIEVQRKQPQRISSDVEKRAAVKVFLQRRHNVPAEVLNKLDFWLTRVSDVAAFMDMAATLGFLTGWVGTAAGIAGIPLFAVGAGLALYDAGRFDITKYQILCVSYTYVAWAFNTDLPTKSSKFLRNKAYSRPVSVYSDEWFKTQMQVIFRLKQEIAKHSFLENDVKLGVRALIAVDDKNTLHKKVIDNFLTTLMAGKPPNHADAVKDLKSYKFPE